MTTAKRVLLAVPYFRLGQLLSQKLDVAGVQFEAAASSGLEDKQPDSVGGGEDHKDLSFGLPSSPARSTPGTLAARSARGRRTNNRGYVRLAQPPST